MRRLLSAVFIGTATLLLAPVVACADIVPVAKTAHPPGCNCPECRGAAASPAGWNSRTFDGGGTGGKPPPPPPGTGDQGSSIAVFLDYTNFQTRLNQMTTAAGVTNLSAAEITTVQSGIMSKIGTIYSGFTISFTQTLPTGNHETVTFGNTATAGTFGQAQEIDF